MPGGQRKAREARRAIASSTKIDNAPRLSKTATKTCYLEPTPPHIFQFHVFPSGPEKNQRPIAMDFATYVYINT